MKYLFVSYEPPSLSTGGKVRSYSFMREIAKIPGNHVALVTIDDGNNIAALSDLKHQKIQVLTVPAVKFSLTKRWLKTIIKRMPPYFVEYESSKLADAVFTAANDWHPDIIQFELLNSYYPCRKIIHALRKAGVFIILNEHNVEFHALKGGVETFSTPKRLVGNFVLPNFKRMETRAVQNPDINLVITCSREDMDILSRLAPKQKFAVVPNGVDCEYFKSVKNESNEKMILFMGGTFYPPNNDALKYYFSKIHPSVLSVIPEIKIYLLGGSHEKWLFNLAKKNDSLVIPGFVEDIRPYLERARVCISPMRQGSGTSLKVLEYMGSGKATVSTSVGARGIACHNGVDIIIADQVDIFAENIIKLLNYPELGLKIGEAARETILQKYDWAGIIKNHDKSLNSLIAKVK